MINGTKIESNQPAYSSLLNKFSSNVKLIDKRNDLAQKLKPYFSVPERILQVGAAESFNWIENGVQSKNVLTFEEILKKYPDFTENEPFRARICHEIKSFNDKHKIICSYHVHIYDQILFEPKIGEIEGFMNALKRFDKKPITVDHLKHIKKNLTIFKENHKIYTDRLAEKINFIVSKRKEYMKQVTLLQIMLTVGDTEEKFDLTLFKTTIAQLKEQQKTLESALRDVVFILSEYNLQRIIWAQMLMNIEFYGRQEKRKDLLGNLCGISLPKIMS